MPPLGGMDRSKIAAEALDLSRSILASLPFGVRLASLVQGFVKAALAKEDLYLSLGLDALLALEKADIQGDIQGLGVSIADLRPFIKRNALSKLKGPATAIGGKIFNMAGVARSTTNMALLESAVMHYQSKELRTKPLDSAFNLGQALKYMANGLNHKVRDEIKIQGRRRELLHEQGQDEGDGAPSAHDTAAWTQIERKVKNTAILMGPSGEPWGWIYIDGKSQGLTENQIIDAWNRSSPGGTGSVTRSMYLNWLKNPQRQSSLRQIAKTYLDESLQERLKLAVASGALDVLPLQDFQRELLALLV